MSGRYGVKWRRLRKVVLDRDGHKCKKCGRRGRLECDHIVPIKEAGPMSWTTFARCAGTVILPVSGGKLTPAESEWAAYLKRFRD